MKRPSPALVVACFALAISLSGAGYAAKALPRNSVGTTQLKANAVNSSKIANGSLLKADFKAGQLPAAGFTTTETKTQTQSVGVFATVNIVALCEAPLAHAVGGGFEITDATYNTMTVLKSAPTAEGDGWVVRAYNVHPLEAANVTAWAVCA